MSFNTSFSFRVTQTEHAAIKALAEQRGLSVSATRPIRERRKQEALDQIRFLAILIDGVFAEREPDLRAELVQVWRERLAEEQRRYD